MDFQQMMGTMPQSEMAAPQFGQPSPQLLAQPAQPAQMPYAATQQGLPPEVQAMNTPVKSAEELEQRKSGWMEVIKKISADPNIMRAIGYFGQSVAQPMPQGQSAIGHLSNGVMTGVNAYQFGKDAEFQRQMAESKNKREVAESEANVEGTKARTAGTVTDNELKTRTLEDSVAKVKTEREKLALDLGKAKDEAERAKIQLAHDKRIAEIRTSLPDDSYRASLDAELKAKGLANDLSKAQASSANATAGYYGAKASEVKAEMDAMKGLSDEEKRQFITKTGKYAGGVGSGQAVMAEYYKGNWKQANPKRAGETDEQYGTRAATALNSYLTTAKDKPEADEFLRWAGLYGTGNSTTDMAAFKKWKGEAPAGSTPGGAATAKRERTFDASGKEVK